MINTATILIAFSLCEVSLAQNYVITRKPKDIFKIPDWMCVSRDIVKQCKRMGANVRKRRGLQVNCTCQCNANNTHNVFGFFENEWKCKSNEDVRSYFAQSCLVTTLQNKDRKSSLKLVIPPPQDNEEYVGKITVKYHNDDIICNLQKTFSYLDCNGAWEQNMNANNIFELYEERHDNRDKELHLYVIRPFDAHVSGRIIKLSISCAESSQLTNAKVYCVLLKTKGSQNCPWPHITPESSTSLAPPSSLLPRTSSPSPITPSTSVAAMVTSSFSLQSTSTLSTLGSTTSSFSSSQTLTSPSIHSTSSQSSLPPTTSVQLPSSRVSTQSTKPLNVNETFQNKGKKDTRTADNTSIIAGAASGVTVLLVIFIVIIIFKKIKGKRNTPGERGGEIVVDNIYEQPVDNHLSPTGQQQSTEEHYDYTYTNNLSASSRKNDIATCQISATKNPTYDQCSPVHEDPVYHTLEDPDTLNTEPVYNVLEGPGDEHATNDAYDVVEGQISSDAPPVYDVLEAPESYDQHEYGSLQTQDPHLYGSLNPSNDCNEGDPSASKGKDIYQELNQADRQSCGGEYQPLSYPRISMNMNQLSEDSSQSCA